MVWLVRRVDTLQQPTWRNTTIIRDNPIESIRELKTQPGKNILTGPECRVADVQRSTILCELSG